MFGGHEIFSAGDDVPELRTLSADEAEVAARVCRRRGRRGRRDPEADRRRHHRLRAGQRADPGAGRRLAGGGDNVKFGATEILAGLVPPGGTARLARAVGASKAKDLVFSGRFVDAKEALALGLIDEMVAPDGVYDAAVAWAQRFVDYSPQVLAAAKAAFDG